MATQIITRTLCDFCQADDVETPDAERIVITINDERWEIDVCKTHGKPLSDFADTLGEYARKVPVGVLAASQPGDESKPAVCPLCGKTYRNRSSLGSHGRQQHNMTIGQLFGRDTGVSLTCEDCGRTFDTKQGIAVHRQRLHPQEPEGATSP